MERPAVQKRTGLFPADGLLPPERELASLPTIQQKELPGAGAELQKLFLEAGQKSAGGMVGTRCGIRSITSSQV